LIVFIEFIVQHFKQPDSSEGVNKMSKKISPNHPGEILFEEFLKPMGIRQNRLAIDIRVPVRRINEIVLKKRRITTDKALRLAKYFNMSPQFWLGLQMDYDLDVAEDLLSERIQKEVHEYQEAV
jgi:addiction module HigA family antidote